MGLAFGWLRSVRPTFGRIPEPALWVFDTVGLAVFIGVVGLNTGPSFVSRLRIAGPSLLLVGFLIRCDTARGRPPHRTLRVEHHPLILWSACAGAGTVTAPPGRFRMKLGGSCSQTEKGHHGRLGIPRGTWY
jgi:putative transport protein